MCRLIASHEVLLSFELHTSVTFVALLTLQLLTQTPLWHLLTFWLFVIHTSYHTHCLWSRSFKVQFVVQWQPSKSFTAAPNHDLKYIHILIICSPLQYFPFQYYSALIPENVCAVILNTYPSLAQSKFKAVVGPFGAQTGLWTLFKRLFCHNWIMEHCVLD